MIVKKFGNGVHVILNKSEFNPGDDVLVIKKADLGRIFNTDMLDSIRAVFKEELENVRG